MKANIAEMLKAAQNNWEEHKRILVSVQNLIKTHPDLKQTIEKFDANFLRKIFRYPGDLTSCRLAKVLERL